MQLLSRYLDSIKYMLCMGILFSVQATFADDKEQAVAVEKYQFESADERALFLELSQELRCPKCQNQNIADSNAMIAEDMKRKVHQLVSKGNDKQQVIHFMKQRYGEFVHYKPPVNPVTIWLYLLPLLFVSGAIWFIVARKKDSERQLIDDSTLQKAEKALEDLE